MLTCLKKSRSFASTTIGEAIQSLLVKRRDEYRFTTFKEVPMDKLEWEEKYCEDASELQYMEDHPELYEESQDSEDEEE